MAMHRKHHLRLVAVVAASLPIQSRPEAARLLTQLLPAVANLAIQLRPVAEVHRTQSVLAVEVLHIRLVRAVVNPIKGCRNIRIKVCQASNRASTTRCRILNRSRNTNLKPFLPKV
jgi:hypothetical protein